MPSPAKEHPERLQPLASAPVSERLAAIREAVSAVWSGQEDGVQNQTDGIRQRAWELVAQLGLGRAPLGLAKLAQLA